MKVYNLMSDVLIEEVGGFSYETYEKSVFSFSWLFSFILQIYKLKAVAGGTVV